MELTSLFEPLPVDPGPVLQIAGHNQIYQVVAVACRVSLFDALRQGQVAGELARRKNFDEITTARLLDVLTHLGLLTKADDRYQTSPIAESYLQPDKLLYLGHHFAADFPAGTFGLQLMNCLQQAPGHGESPEPGWNPERLRQIGAASLNGSIQATVNAVDLSATKRLLDLGGGHGFYSIALAQKYPSLSVTLFDLPQVIALAREHVARFGLESRIRLAAGDFLREDIGGGYDAVVCANILHSTKRDVVLGKVRHALSGGGRIIVKCRIDDAPPTLANALAKLIWQVRGGKELFNRDEWRQFLLLHGFSEIETPSIHGIFATITGIKK